MRVILGQEAGQQQQPPPTAQQPPPPPVAAAAESNGGGGGDDGYNSGDEYASYVESLRSRGLDEAQFAALLQSARGFEIRRMAPDGACLFRAIGANALFFFSLSLCLVSSLNRTAAADQVYGDQELHGMVREMCCNFMVCINTISRSLLSASGTNRKRADRLQRLDRKALFACALFFFAKLLFTKSSLWTLLHISPRDALAAENDQFHKTL